MDTGFSASERYPATDGIIAGMPANDRINEIAGYSHVAGLAQDGVNILPTPKLQVLADAVMKACDA